MGLIIKQLKVMGDKGEAMVNCLFDTGASDSFIRRDIQEKIATSSLLREPKVFSLGLRKGRLETNKVAFFDIELPEGRIFDYAAIASSLGEEMIIGAGTMQKYRIKLDLEHDDIILDKKALELKLV